MPVLLTVLVVVANVLGAGMIVPQVVRLRRTRSVDGISVAGVGVGLAQNAWWTAYGLLAEGAFGIVPVSVAGGVLYAVIASQLVSLAGWRVIRALASGFVGIGVVPIAPLLMAGLPAAGLTIGLLYGVQFTPPAVAAIRSDRPVGVSPVTWSMALVEALIWLVYGLEVGDPALSVGGAGGAFMSTVILIRLASVRIPPRRRPRLAV